MVVWNVTHCDYDIVEGGGGQTKVTNLHWSATLQDGDLNAYTYGSVGDDQNRVYALPALRNVPESVMVKWVHDAMEPGQQAQIEQMLADDIVEQKTPTSGGLTPAEG